MASLDARRIRGGFPRSFLADDDEGSWQWRDHYVRTFLERDIPGLGIRIPPIALRRFWMMLAHYHGQVFNASEIARSLGVADTTASRYLDVLAGTYMVRRLPPWFENIGKRIGYEVKYTDRPKTTRSQHLALEHLHLDQLTVVVPGDADYPLADGIRVCGLNAAVGDRGSRAGS